MASLSISSACTTTRVDGRHKEWSEAAPFGGKNLGAPMPQRCCRVGITRMGWKSGCGGALSALEQNWAISDTETQGFTVWKFCSRLWHQWELDFAK